MTKPIVHNIFPVPIYKTKINRGFTKQELNFVKEQKKHCKDYLDTIICPKNNVELYITQSWLNYTESDQYHHKHEHPNSVVSGVLYFDSDVKNDKILFSHSKGYQQISPEIDKTKFNLWNSGTWFFPVETGGLFMFPSSTTHQVETKKGTNTRISLAFNTFYKGTLGLNKKLTELII